jgi:hypothetical protein
MIQHFSSAHSAQELYRYWHSLPALYGPATSGHISAGDRLLNLLAQKMPETSSFTATMTQMELEFKDAKLPDEFRSALLFSDGSNDLKIQFLPSRFNAAIAHIRNSNLQYAEAKIYLHQQDQLLSRTTTAAINAVSTSSAQPTAVSKRKGKKNKQPINTLEGDKSQQGHATQGHALVTTDHSNCCVVCCCGDSFQPKHATDTFCDNCFNSFKEHQRKSKEHFIRGIRNVRTQEALDDYEALEDYESGRYLR